MLPHFIGMSPIEELGPFVSFFQACGLIPYTMEYGLTTRKFVKFSFSFKNVTTWWFLLVIVSQTIVPFLASKTHRSMISDITTNSPVTVSIMFATIVFGYFSQLLFFRWMMLFRYNRLQSAVKLAETAEKHLGLFHNNSNAPKSSLLSRFVIGFLLIIIKVSNFL